MDSADLDDDNHVHGDSGLTDIETQARPAKDKDEQEPQEPNLVKSEMESRARHQPRPYHRGMNVVTSLRRQACMTLKPLVFMAV